MAFVIYRAKSWDFKANRGKGWTRDLQKVRLFNSVDAAIFLFGLPSEEVKGEVKVIPVGDILNLAKEGEVRVLKRFLLTPH